VILIKKFKKINLVHKDSLEIFLLSPTELIQNRIKQTNLKFNLLRKLYLGLNIILIILAFTTLALTAIFASQI
jgi:small-conductance mechanosensitive channel